MSNIETTKVQITKELHTKLKANYGSPSEVHSACLFSKETIASLQSTNCNNKEDLLSVLSIFNFLESGEEYLTKELSQDNPSLEDKIKGNFNVLNQKLKTPPTCKAFSNKGKCDACAYKDKIETPCQAKSKSFYPSEVTDFYRIENSRKVPAYDELAQKIADEHQTLAIEETAEMYSFNGKYYEPFPDIKIFSIIDKYTGHKYKSQDKKEIKLRLTSINFRPKDWMRTSTESIIPLQNGLYNTNTNEFGPFSKDVGVTSLIDYEYNPKAECPTFDNFLLSISGKKDMPFDIEWIHYSLQIFGYAISNCDYLLQKFFIIYGPTAGNGKGTFMQLLQKMVPKSTSIKLDKFANENYLAGLDGSYFNFADESNSRDFKQQGLTSNILTLSSGSPITVSKKYQHPFELKNKSKLFFVCNDLPAFEDIAGIDRRMCVIPFDMKFEAGINEDKYMLEKLLAERSGIFNKLMDHYKILKKNNFELPKFKRAMDQVLSYKKETDPSYMWIEENLELTTSDRQEGCFKHIVYDLYQKEMKAGNLKVENDIHFFRKVRKFFKVDVEEERSLDSQGIRRRRMNNIRFKGNDL